MASLSDGASPVARSGCATASRVVAQQAWERLHHGAWRDVSVIWRELYAAAVLAQCCSDEALSSAAACLPLLDRALMMGGPASRAATADLAHRVEQRDGDVAAPQPALLLRTSPSDEELGGLHGAGCSIQRVAAPSLAEFQRRYMNTKYMPVALGAARALTEAPCSPARQSSSLGACSTGRRCPTLAASGETQRI